MNDRVSYKRGDVVEVSSHTTAFDQNGVPFVDTSVRQGIVLSRKRQNTGRDVYIVLVGLVKGLYYHYRGVMVSV